MPGPHHDKNELGGSHVHVTNGAIDDEAESEDEAFALARRFLSYLPTSVDELPHGDRAPTIPSAATRCCSRSSRRNPRHVYKMRAIIEAIVDRDADGTSSFFEIGRQWGKSIICGLARFNGWPVALFAEDPYVYGGAWTASSSQKVTRLIDLATTFHLPLVHLVDCPGFLIGLQAEQEGTIRYGSRGVGRARREPVAVLLGRHPQGVRRRGRREHEAGQLPLPVRVAVGRLGLAADRRRHRGGLQGRARRGRRPRRAPRRDQGSPRSGALAVPQRRSVRHRGHHRSARHALSCAGGPTSSRACDDRERGRCASAPERQSPRASSSRSTPRAPRRRTRSHP